jgi:hypothetical protein
MTHGTAAKRAAREARSSPALRVLARGGYAANGVVHVLIGMIVVAIALGGKGESDQAGAFKAIGAAPLGFVALWALAILLAALGVWHAANGLIASRSSDVKKWGVRISEWSQALVFLALGAIAASVALGARPNADEAAEEASRGVLNLPGGAWLLGLTGIGIGVGGIAFVVMGVRRSFHSKVAIPESRAGTLVTTLGVIGFVAKGVALVVVGILLVIAAARVDPDTAAGLDGAIRSLLDVFGGPFLVAVVGAGFIAYGVFCFFRARYARL